MEPIPIIEIRKAYWWLLVLCFGTFTLLMVSIFLEEAIQSTFNLSPNAVRGVLFFVLLFSGLAVRFSRSYREIGFVHSNNNMIKIETPNLVIELPLNEVELKINEYSGQQIYRFIVLETLQLWEDGTGNYLKFNYDGQPKTLRLLVKNKKQMTEWNKVKLTTTCR